MKIERIPLVSISISSKIAQRRLKPDIVETFFLVFVLPSAFKEPIETWFYTSLIRTFGARKSSYARPGTGKRNRERWQPISLYVRRAAKCVIVSGRSIWVHMCERSRVCESKRNPAVNEVVFFSPSVPSSRLRWSDLVCLQHSFAYGPGSTVPKKGPRLVSRF